MIVRVSIMLGMLLFAASVVTGCGGAATAPQIGDEAPDFTLETIDGESISLSDFRGNRVLIVFRAVYCKGCDEQEPYILAVYERSAETLTVLDIYRLDPPSRVRKHVDDKQLTAFPALPDPDDAVGGKTYRLAAMTPINVLVDASGIIKAIKPGPFQSQEEIEGWLESL